MAAKRALIIGGGVAGCAMAHQFALAGGWDVTLIEAGPQLGAGVRTQWLGGHPYTFGPRHYLTQNERVWEYMDALCPLRRCAEHEFVTYVEGDKAWYGYPIHVDDIPRMPEAATIAREREICAGIEVGPHIEPPRNLEEMWRRSVGPTLYSKFIDAYSRKMWMVDSNTEIDDFAWSPKGVTIKDGPRAAWDTALSGYPIAPNGYDEFFARTTRDATVHLRTSIAMEAGGAALHRLAGEYDVVVSTISPDVWFNRSLGELPYIGRDLIPIVLPVKYALPETVYFAYYAGAEPYTRVTEYKKFTRHEADDTLITLEIPSLRNKHYPLPMKKWQDLAQSYHDMMPSNVFNIGRAGTYRYNVHIAACIEQAMEVIEKLK